MSKRDLQICCRELLLKLSTAAKIAIVALVSICYVTTECELYGASLKCLIVGWALLGVIMFIDKVID